jgi:hypothetical protein
MGLSGKAYGSASRFECSRRRAVRADAGLGVEKWLLPPEVTEFIPEGHVSHFVRDLV